MSASKTGVGTAEHSASDLLCMIYTLTANKSYGKAAICETRGTLPPGLFPEVLADWELIFQDTVVPLSPPPTTQDVS